MSETAQINPKILSWARETAGLSVEEAAEKLGFRDTTKATAAERLVALENGKPEPSMSTLQKAGSVYRRPLITFFMSNPPVRAERGEDFRASSSGTPRDNAMLDALVRNIRARQEMLREVLEDEEEAEELEFIGSASIKKGAAAVVRSIRSVLGVVPESQKSPNPPALFNMLRAAAEKVGIYVLLLGDVGSHHSDVSEDVFRGFALADKVAPFVVLGRLQQRARAQGAQRLAATGTKSPQHGGRAKSPPRRPVSGIHTDVGMDGGGRRGQDVA